VSTLSGKDLDTENRTSFYAICINRLSLRMRKRDQMQQRNKEEIIILVSIDSVGLDETFAVFIV
jgi:hypothetical protein